VHGDRFFEKKNNQTVTDHAKITWFWAMENNQVPRKIYADYPIYCFWRTLGIFAGIGNRLIIVDVKVCPM
jgi:hypothetical protein